MAPRLLAVLALLLLLAVAAWLRWEFITQVDPHVDEFTTLWAAEQVQELGIPRLPSGVLYTRGLLHSYIEAGALTLANARSAVEQAGTMTPLYIAGRLPNLAIGLATILLVYWVGRRAWGRSAGLLAALGLALLPEAIVWSGRARFYGLLQLLTLLLLWTTWEWLQSDRSAPAQTLPRYHRWGYALGWALLFTLTLFTQEQALLLLPGMLLAMLLWRGVRWMFAPPQVTAFVLVALAAGARYAVEIWGQPGYFETIQSTRPYVGWIFDLQGAWTTYATLFVAPWRLPWTIAVLYVLTAACIAWARLRALASLSATAQSVLFYAINLLVPVAAIFLLVGTSWRETRYLFFVQPLWLLLGAAGVITLTGHLPQSLKNRNAWQVAATAGVAALLAAAMAGPAISAARQQEVGYSRVLEKVAAQRQPGDAVLSPQPPACALVLGPCDGYAVQRGYEEYVIKRNGILIDRWSGAPLIDSVAALRATVLAAPRTWFVADGFRLATRYEADYLRFLLTHFDPIIDERGALALRSDGLRAEPRLDVTLPITNLAPFGPLQVVRARRNSDFGPDTPLIVDLEWIGTGTIGTQINTSVRLVNRAGEVIAQSDGPPARGIIPTILFFDTPLPDTKVLTLPVGLPDERYRIDLTAYEVGAPDAAGQQAVMPLGPPQPIGWLGSVGSHAPLTPPVGSWQNGLTLLTVRTEPQELTPGSTFTVHLIWASDAPTPSPLTAFVHLIDPAGNVVTQHDKQPEDGFFPTSAWDAATGPVADIFTLPIPASPTLGRWRLVTGWYDANTGNRVLTTDGADSIELATFSLP